MEGSPCFLGVFFCFLGFPMKDCRFVYMFAPSLTRWKNKIVGLKVPTNVGRLFLLLFYP
jgi:hypothetical protein